MKNHEKKEIQLNEKKEVPEQMDTLRRLLEEIDNRLFSFEERLSSVSVNEPPTVAQEEVKERVLVPLANEIRERCNQVKNMLHHVESICDRLQI